MAKKKVVKKKVAKKKAVKKPVKKVIKKGVKKVAKKKPVKRQKNVQEVLIPSNKQTGSSDKKRDADRTALAPGKRRSRSGRIYYEYRKNHSDKPGSVSGIRKGFAKLVNYNTDKGIMMLLRKFKGDYDFLEYELKRQYGNLALELNFDKMKKSDKDRIRKEMAFIKKVLARAAKLK